MTHITLKDTLVKKILAHLGCERKSPTLRYLNELITAYTRRVPWESVTRIIKRRLTASSANCPRWPEEFWQNAIAYGTGGTCFESSLAFFSLLTSLGYRGYLTVNDMWASRACHAAITILLKDSKYLVDVTIPVHQAVRIDPGRVTRHYTSLHTYVIRPTADDTYQVDRTAHPNRNAFTLIDRPVLEPDYREIVTRDYEETGHFLKSLVIVKVIDDKVWRFNSAEKPFKLTGFNRTEKSIILLSPYTLARVLARKFRMPEEKIAAALSYVEDLPEAAGFPLSTRTYPAGMSLSGGG
jgi:arylamine N-acetyltransferase